MESKFKKKKKKVFNSLKPLLIVPREQQIGPGYKTVIDLWKVEATAHSQVPVLNCMPALSFHEAVIIKKMELFPAQKEKKKSLDDAESVIKGWILLLQLYMISFPDLLGWGADLPGAEKAQSHALVVSRFTFKTYMSVNLTASLAHIFHSAETQIFKLNQRRKNWCPAWTYAVITFSTSAHSALEKLQAAVFSSSSRNYFKISALFKQKCVLVRIVWVSLISDAYPLHQGLLKFKAQTSIVTK